MHNLVSVSSAPVAKLGNKKYYDLDGTLEVLKELLHESAVDGFELQLEPEWDSETPPLSDAHYADWSKTPKYSFNQVRALVRNAKLPILSVHASRDIGIYLCSDRQQYSEKGRRLIYDSLRLTEELGAEVCVFHLWDTWKTRFDLGNLQKVFYGAATQFPKVKASVENIPTHLEGQTPYHLVGPFEYVTVDLKWASMYNELQLFESIAHKIVNVHLRGRLDGSRWSLDQSSLGFYEAFDKIKNEWRYSGLFTVEPEGPMDNSRLGCFLEAMRSLRAGAC